MNQSSTAAAKHFLNLYSEEMNRKEVTADVIYEWWGQTKDQYPEAVYEDIEQEILSKL